HERDKETQGKEHRHGEMDIAAPQCQHPVINLDSSRNGDDQRGEGEEEAEIRIHAADIHMMRPDDEAERADADDRPDHHAIAKDVFPGMGADEIGDDAKSRQSHDIDFRMSEKPEEMLEQDRAAPAIFEMLPHL